MSSLEDSGSGTRTSADRSDTSDHDSSSTVDTLQQQAGRVTDEVREQAVSLGEDARQQLRTQARVQTDHLGETLGSVADHLHALADGRPEEAGQARDLLDRIADQVEDVSQRIDRLGFDGAIDELQRFARRRPGVFLASAAAIGFAGSRLAQGARANREGPGRDDHTGDGRGMGSGAGSAYRSGQRSTPEHSGQPPADRPPTATSGPSVVPAGAAPGPISGPAAREGGR